mmetsp:Transcript_48294/g.151462  ORF Transcript_48294/g.151462 Transcript_48294/m.151462 type:complete len:315 (+) Transcript_48294:1213-2157(+)
MPTGMLAPSRMFAFRNILFFARASHFAHPYLSLATNVVLSRQEILNFLPFSLEPKCLANGSSVAISELVAANSAPLIFMQHFEPASTRVAIDKAHSACAGFRADPSRRVPSLARPLLPQRTRPADHSCFSHGAFLSLRALCPPFASRPLVPRWPHGSWQSPRPRSTLWADGPSKTVHAVYSIHTPNTRNSRLPPLRDDRIDLIGVFLIDFLDVLRDRLHLFVDVSLYSSIRVTDAVLPLKKPLVICLHLAQVFIHFLLLCQKLPWDHRRLIGDRDALREGRKLHHSCSPHQSHIRRGVCEQLLYSNRVVEIHSG